MELLKAAAAFVVILGLLNFKLPLFAGMLGGTAVLAVLFGVELPVLGRLVLDSVTSWSTLEVCLAMYVISALQQSLDRRKHLEKAQAAMNGLLGDQRLNAALASIFIGMMPAAPAVVFCGRIMDNMAGGYLTKEEKAACATYYRHIPEGVLPTYPLIIIACTLGGVSIASFVVAMLPMVAVLIAIGFLFYLRKVPKNSGTETAGGDKAASVKQLARSLWSIFVSIAIIIAFGLPAWLAVALVTAVNFFVDRFSPGELKDILTAAFDWKMISGTFAVFIFKDVLIYTGILDVLPGVFSGLPIPPFLAMALLFFFGTLVASSTAVGSAFVPMAFGMLEGGAPLLVLLMGFSYAASQISPTHICITVIAEYFQVSLGSLIRRVAPMVLTYAVILVGYYLLLSMVF